MIMPVRRPDHHSNIRRSGSYPVANVEKILSSLPPRLVYEDQVTGCLETSGGERQKM